LFAAYAAVWVGNIVYVRSIERRTRELEDELQDIRSRRGRKRRPEINLGQARRRGVRVRRV
jgi:CcmD family protein